MVRVNVHGAVVYPVGEVGSGDGGWCGMSNCGETSNKTHTFFSFSSGAQRRPHPPPGPRRPPAPTARVPWADCGWVVVVRVRIWWAWSYVAGAGPITPDRGCATVYGNGGGQDGCVGVGPRARWRPVGFMEGRRRGWPG